MLLLPILTCSLNKIIIIIINLHFFNAVSNTKCHSMALKTEYSSRIGYGSGSKSQVDSQGRKEAAKEGRQDERGEF